MCCIFTWLAWCFDASHRAVVFFMACLISASACCLLLVASLAGVAMGYNYSLAEYIDLKETNISVYIKRGVYDDEIADDFDWRRAGGGEPSISFKDNMGVRVGSESGQGQQPLASGRRRSESSIFESDEQNKYEGGLMRLTSTPTAQLARRLEPPEPPYTTPTSSTTNVVDGLLELADSLPGGSMGRLKAIQAAARHHEAQKVELATAKIPDDPLNRVKAIEANAQIHSARRADLSTTTDKYSKYFNNLVQHPGFPGSGLSARRFMEAQQKDLETKPPNRFRDAVFRGDLSGWPASDAPKSTDNFFEYDVVQITTPTPATVKPDIVRPVEGKRPIINWDDPHRAPASPILLSKPAYKEFPSNIPRSKILQDASSEYDDARGLPVRRKRSNDNVSVKILKSAESSEGSLLTIKTTSYENPQNLNEIDAELDKFTNIESTLVNGETKSENSTTELKNSNFDNNSTNTTKVIFLEPNNNNSNIGPSDVDSLELLSSTEKPKDVNMKLDNRSINSEDYKHQNQEHKNKKSIWWQICDGIQERWKRLLVFLNTRVYPILSYRNYGSDDSDRNSSYITKTTFINKLVAMSTEKLESLSDTIVNNT